MFALIICFVSFAALTDVTRATPTEQAIFERPRLIVNTSFLNIRVGPSANFAVLETVAGGTELPVLGTAGDEVWYQVVTPSGSPGWVNIEFTIPRGDFTNVPLVQFSAEDVQQPSIVVSPPSSPNVPVAPVPRLVRSVVIVNTSALNVRSGPGSQFAKLFTAGGGTQFPVIGITPDDAWFLVQTADGQGWVNSEFIVFRGDINTVPIIEYGSIPEAQLDIEPPVAIVNTSFLNVRSGPGAQFTQVFVARGGSEFPVLGLASDGVWFLVQTPNGQGWVNNEFVIFRGSIEAVPIVELADAGGVLQTPVAVFSGSIALYAAPGVNFGLLGTVVGPVEAPIVARTPEFDWIQINTSVGFGWVPADQVIVRGEASLIPVVNE